jgi:glycosyltransferase involved in cell wall biosynthesis
VIYAVKQSKVPLVCTLHNYRLLCPSAILFYQGHVFLDSLQRAFPWKAVKKGVYKNSRLLTFWMAFAMQVHHWLGTWHLPNRFVVLSKHAKELFMQSGIKFREGQLIIKPNFCSLPPLEAVNRTGEFVFIGRLSEEKGVPLLLKAFSSSTHKITIVGDGPLREEVKTYSQKYPNISYAGYLQKTEVVNLLSHSSALVFPSIWYEAMPLTVIEALACGTPVIATKLGAMEYMVTPNQDGILFEAGNETKLQQALNIWADLSTSEKERYSKNARATYEQFYTPAKNAEQLLAIYHSVQKVPEPASLSFAG